MATYVSASQYIESCTSIKGKIAAIDAIIDALLLTAAKSAESENISQYSLNDGQTIISTTYKGTQSVVASIAAFRTLRASYAQMLTGRVVRLVDSKNFPGYGFL